MIVTIDILRQAGCSKELIIRIVELVDNERTAARREQNRINKRNQRRRQHVSADADDVADSDDTPYKEEKSPSTPPSKEETTPLGGRAKRATRLPEEWKPSEEAIKFANDHGWLGKPLDDEIIKFHNYWVSKSGQNATKCNWERTWQNWILNAGKPKEGLANGHHANPAAIRRTSDAVSETLARRQERFRFG